MTLAVHRYSTIGYRPPEDHRAAFEAFGHTVIDWNTPDWPDLVALAQATEQLVHPNQRPRHEANVVRLGILAMHGGCYVDWDLTPLAPFTDLPSPASAAHHGGTRCNCWLAFPVQHPALDQALAAIAAQTGPQRASTQVSGEALLEQLWDGDIARVPVYRDIDGRTNPAAPRVLAHAGATAGTL